MALAETFGVPYYAVIFTSLRTEREAREYDEAAQRMLDLVRQQPGFLGVESARGDNGLGITVSYWASEAAILAWKEQPQHREIRERGRRPGTGNARRGFPEWSGSTVSDVDARSGPFRRWFCSHRPMWVVHKAGLLANAVNP